MITGIAQIDVIWEDAPQNMKKIESFVKEASKNSVELILFPEMVLTGFTMDVDKLVLSEEEIIKWISHIAVNNRINIGLGFAVKVDEKGKNKYVIVSEDGKVLALYTKIHPFSYSGEDEKYYRGNEIFNCKVKEFQVTPFICYDLRFPEIFQFASKNSQVITVSASWPKSREEHWITLLKARAMENQCYIIGINRIGFGDDLEYGGKSIFVSPDGKILNEMNSREVLIIEDLKMEEIKDIKDRFDIKKDRREDLYIFRGLSKGANINDK